DLIDDFFADHPARTVGNLGHDLFWNITAHLHWAALAHNLGLICCVRNLALYNVRTVNGTVDRHWCADPADAGAAAFILHQSRPGRSRNTRRLHRPSATVLLDGAAACHRTHDGIATLLIDRFGDRSHHDAAAFAFAGFKHRALHGATAFAHRILPDGPT